MVEPKQITLTCDAATLRRAATFAGVNVFSRMVLTFPDGGPASAHSSTYILDNVPR